MGKKKRKKKGRGADAGSTPTEAAKGAFPPPVPFAADSSHIPARLTSPGSPVKAGSGMLSPRTKANHLAATAQPTVVPEESADIADPARRFESLQSVNTSEPSLDVEDEASVVPTYRFDAVLEKTNEFQSQYPQLTVYCSEQFLQAISDSVAALADDSAGDVTKYSVDRPLLSDPANLNKILSNNPTYGIGLVEHTLGEYAAELEPVEPVDFQEFPERLSAEKIPDPTLREWALQLNHLWKILCFKYREEVKLHSVQYSCIYLEHPIVVPGGRFRELYYWDEYWVIIGLLECGMFETTKGLIFNFFAMIEKFGFIPNANRVYYLNRSQPPMLSEMVSKYIEFSKDTSILEPAVTALNAEHLFWMKRRGVDVTDASTEKVYRLNRYYADVDGPRPESYIDDMKSVAGLSAEKKKRVFREMAACCESGWDFSSRWFGDKSGLATAYISELIPVDLNAILYRMELNLVDFHTQLGNTSEAAKYKAAAEIRKEAVDIFLWDGKLFFWLDYHYTKGRRVSADRMYPSNFMGMWANWFPDSVEIKDNIVKAFQESGLIAKTGVATSTQGSGQQWDWPNCWAPIQYFCTQGLLNVGTEEAVRQAQDLIMKWLLTNLVGFSKKVDTPDGPEVSRAMHEKYHANLVGERGAGGEYTPQIGFGWSNGLVLHHLASHGQLLSEVFPVLLAETKLAERQGYQNMDAPLWNNVVGPTPVEKKEGGRVEFADKLMRSPFIEESAEEIMKTALFDLTPLHEDKMERRKFQRHMAVFQSLFRRYVHQKTVNLVWDRVKPPVGIINYADILPQRKDRSSTPVPASPEAAYTDFAAADEAGEDTRALLNRLIVVKLNGGLGTSMGIHAPKCATDVGTEANGRVFTILDVVVRQISALNQKYDVDIPLVLMNSFYTHEQTQRITRRYQEMVRICLFQQKKCPRFYKDTQEPLPNVETFTDKSNWYPPGHGDLYDSFVNSDVFSELKNEGKDWAFVSNIDNIGANVDINILRWLTHTQEADLGCVDFCMEVTERYPSDVKIGTLVSYGDRYKLVEVAQVEAMNNPAHMEAFQSIKSFHYMNTNNLWMRLDSMEAVLPILSLDIIVREVSIGGKNARRKVIQLETAVGGAIQHFNNAVGLMVPRRRYVPIKTTADLLVVRSSIFKIDPQGHLSVSLRRVNRMGDHNLIPTIRLGPEYERLEDYESRIPESPNIIDLEHLTVVGDVYLGHNVTLKGSVVLMAEEGRVLDIPNGAVLDNKVVTGSMRVRDH